MQEMTLQERFEKTYTAWARKIMTRAQERAREKKDGCTTVDHVLHDLMMDHNFCNHWRHTTLPVHIDDKTWRSIAVGLDGLRFYGSDPDWAPYTWSVVELVENIEKLRVETGRELIDIDLLFFGCVDKLSSDCRNPFHNYFTLAELRNKILSVPTVRKSVQGPPSPPENPVSRAMTTLRTKMAEDRDYARAWVANLTMTIADTLPETTVDRSHVVAVRIMKLLFSTEIPEDRSKLDEWVDQGGKGVLERAQKVLEGERRPIFMDGGKSDAAVWGPSPIQEFMKGWLQSKMLVKARQDRMDYYRNNFGWKDYQTGFMNSKLGEPHDNPVVVDESAEMEMADVRLVEDTVLAAKMLEDQRLQADLDSVEKIVANGAYEMEPTEFESQSTLSINKDGSSAVKGPGGTMTSKKGGFLYLDDNAGKEKEPAFVGWSEGKPLISVDWIVTKAEGGIPGHPESFTMMNREKVFDVEVEVGKEKERILQSFGIPEKITAPNVKNDNPGTWRSLTAPEPEKVLAVQVDDTGDKCVSCGEATAQCCEKCSEIVPVCVNCHCPRH